MRTLSLSTLGTLFLVAGVGCGPDQVDIDRLLGQAERDWDTGHYVEALEAADALLSARPDEGQVRRIAELTGEPFLTTELTDDGLLPAISPRGRYAGYATRGQNQVTRIVDLENGPAVIVEVEGAHRLDFSPDERSATYLADGRVMLIELPGGDPLSPAAADPGILEAVFGADGDLYAVVGTDEEAEVFRFARSAEGFDAGEQLTRSGGPKSEVVPVPGHGKLVYEGGGMVRVHELGAGTERAYPAVDRAVSADGSTLVFSRRGDGVTGYYTLDLSGSGEARRVFETSEPVAELAVSPGGARFAFRLLMPEHNWEIFAVDSERGTLARVSNEPQHDWAPQFLTETTLFALKGERRNRRIFHYDLRTGHEFELFLNNTVRTVEPQTEWFPSADGTRIIIRAERDGNTVTPEQGVYVTDLTRPVTQGEVQARVRAQLASERDLRTRGERMFAPIDDDVRAVTSEVSRDRLSEYVAGLVDVGPRHITEPGNALATDWVAELFESFGYESERHAYRAQGIDQENVFVTLPGTTSPELVYVVAAHFDAVRNSPGADDDATGMAVVFEAARVLRENPQPATIIFMGFNGEEAGLYGARAWVPHMVEQDIPVMGLVNHEVLGWTRHHRLDNTIRHNNNDLRDATHAAAFRYSRMITYDSYYTRSTDAQIFHNEYGEIVTALAGFPILGSPHYHQPTDEVRTINMQLVAESAKTTTATVMLMASSPAPVKGLRVDAQEGGRIGITWDASPENDVVSYTVVYGPADDPEANELTVDAPTVTLQNAPTGTRVKVRANNERGMHGWGWGRLTVE